MLLCMYPTFSFVDAYLDRSHKLAMANYAVVKMNVHVFLQSVNLDSFRYVLRSDLAGLYVSSLFVFLKKYSIDFQSS